MRAATINSRSAGSANEHIISLSGCAPGLVPKPSYAIMVSALPAIAADRLLGTPLRLIPWTDLSHEPLHQRWIRGERLLLSTVFGCPARLIC